MANARTKTFQKGSPLVFRRAVDTLKTTPNDLCEMLGYQPKAFTSWYAKGEIPKVVEVACLSMIEAHMCNADARGNLLAATTWVAVSSDANQAALESFCTAVGIVLHKIATA